MELLSPSDKEKVYIPNEIFKDFQNRELFNSASQTVIAYCYYCLISYLFRYCKYGQGSEFNPETLKEILGYAANNKKLDIIVKKGGSVDLTGYTETIRDFPISYTYGEIDGLQFEMYSDFDAETKALLAMPKNFKIKKPVKAFFRDVESEKEGIYDGVYYEINNTHLFDVLTFIEMMCDKGLGISAFYIYQYIRHKNDLHTEGYAASLYRLEREIGLSVDTLNKYLKKLEQRGYIEVERAEFDKRKEFKDRIANTYRLIGKG